MIPIRAVIYNKALVFWFVNTSTCPGHVTCMYAWHMMSFKGGALNECAPLHTDGVHTPPLN